MSLSNYKKLIISLFFCFLSSCSEKMPGKEEIQFFELSESSPPVKLDFDSGKFNLRGKNLTLVLPPIWHNKDIDLFLCMKKRVCFMWQSLLTSPNGQLSSSIKVPDKKSNVELKILLKFNENKSFEYFFPLEKI